MIEDGYVRCIRFKMADYPRNRTKPPAQNLECHACGPPHIFRHQPTEKLFQKYAFHIRRATVSTLLGVYILVTAVIAILYFAYQRKPSEKNLVHITLCILGICLYIFINTKFFRTVKQLTAVAYCQWVLLLLLAFLSLPLGTWTTEQVAISPYPTDGLWQFMLVIYSMYMVTPVNFFMTLIFGIVLSLVHTAVIVIRIPDRHERWIEVGHFNSNKFLSLCYHQIVLSDSLLDLILYMTDISSARACQSLLSMDRNNKVCASAHAFA